MSTKSPNESLLLGNSAIQEPTSLNEFQFREMLDALPVAIYTTDAEGRLTYFNPAAIQFSGHIPNLGTSQWCVSWKLYHPDGTLMPHSECPMAIALKENRPVGGMEAIAERPDGTRIWFVPYPSPLRDKTGQVTGGINMLLDITERKQAEKTQAYLAAIVESSEDAIITKNLDGIITSWNHGAEKIFGYKATETVGKSITMLIPAQRVEEETRILESIRRGEKVDHFETLRQRKDGTFIEISLTVSPIQDEAGNIIGASKIARDISDRKHAERVLREYARQQEALHELSEHLHRANSLDGTYKAAVKAILTALHCDRASILLFDNTGVMRFVAWHGLSDEYRKATEGHSPWKSDAKNVVPVYFNDIDPAELDASLKATIKTEGIGSLAFIPLLSNGQLIGKFMVYFNRPHVFSEGELDLSLTIARQLAFGIDRTRAEAKLRESEARFRSLSNAVPSFVWTAAPDGTVIYLNERWHQYTGLHSEEHPNTARKLVLHPDDYERFVHTWTKAVETVSDEFLTEVRYRRYDGEYRWFQTRAVPTRDSAGHVKGWYGVTMDIHDRIEAEKALRTSKESYQNLFEQVPVAVYTCDANGLIQEFNQRAAELWGREPKKNHPEDSFCGSFKIYSPDGQFIPHKKCPMARLLRGEILAPHEFEVLIERPNGERKFIIAHPRVLKNENGQIVGAVNCLYDLTARKQAEQALHESQQQLQLLNETLEQKVKEQTIEVRLLASELTQAEHHERHRISLILHDDLQQRLYALQMQMAFLRKGIEYNRPRVLEDLAEINEHLNEVITMARHLSIDLSPPILHDEGLVQAISWISAQMKQQYDLSVEIWAEDSFVIPNRDLQVLLFNCVRELLFNIVKHAGVNQAWVSIKRSNHLLHIEVRDEGKGFNLNGLSQQNGKGENKSFGIPMLRHRLSVLGGHMEIKSELDAGTSVMLTMPAFATDS